MRVVRAWWRRDRSFHIPSGVSHNRFIADYDQNGFNAGTPKYSGDCAFIFAHLRVIARGTVCLTRSARMYDVC